MPNWWIYDILRTSHKLAVKQLRTKNIICQFNWINFFHHKKVYSLHIFFINFSSLDREEKWRKWLLTQHKLANAHFLPLLPLFIAFSWCLSMNKKWEKNILHSFGQICGHSESAMFSIKRNLCRAPLTKCTKADRISLTFIMLKKARFFSREKNENFTVIINAIKFMTLHTRSIVHVLIFLF